MKRSCLEDDLIVKDEAELIMNEFIILGSSTFDIIQQNIWYHQNIQLREEFSMTSNTRR